jgi:hypothetical protein
LPIYRSTSASTGARTSASTSAGTSASAGASTSARASTVVPALVVALVLALALALVMSGIYGETPPSSYHCVVSLPLRAITVSGTRSDIQAPEIGFSMATHLLVHTHFWCILIFLCDRKETARAHLRRASQGRFAPLWLLFPSYLTGKQVDTRNGDTPSNLLPWKGELWVLVYTCWSPVRSILAYQWDNGCF